LYLFFSLLIVFILVRAVKVRQDRSKANVDQYEETRSSAEIAQWLYRRFLALDAEAQRFAQGNVSVTFIVSDDNTGTTWQHMSSGDITAVESKLLREVHTLKLASSTAPRPELADEAMKCSAPDMWPRREQESLISFFAGKDEMKEFFAKV
jgi:hypothetical protein